MRRETFQYIVGLLLILSVIMTGLLGYVQSQLELRKFVPHRYFAYTTLCLATLHVYLNWKKLWSYIRRLFRKNNDR
jgi:hypothetical protein